MAVEDWKGSIKSLCFAEKGLGESFFRYLMRDPNGRGIPSEKTIRLYPRGLSALFHKYTGRHLDEATKNHFYQVAVSEITPYYGLRRTPKPSPPMGPEFFIQHIHFLWVRSRESFFIGLDRTDDATIRHLCMWTGCRKHELVYNKPQNCEKLVKEHDDESDAYADVEPDPVTFGPRPIRERRHNRELKLLCWEDINFSIIQDPFGGRDRLVMHVLLQWHKGENKKVVPTWFPIIEEDIPALCPVTHILSKAIAEEPFFNTKLSNRAVFIQWKQEWMHKPAFRADIDALGGESDAPQTGSVFDQRSDRLGQEMGLLDKLSQYCYRRGTLQTVDRHYRTSAQTRQLNLPSSLPQPNDERRCPGRLLRSRNQLTILAILNQIGLYCDENAPQSVPDDVMEMIGPSRTVDRLEQELERMRTSLSEQHGRPSQAPADERAQYTKVQTKLRTARQDHRRKLHKLIYKDYFKKRAAAQAPEAARFFKRGHYVGGSTF
ncbi:hypothetical protein TOPH_08097 [Tolypocladium ophioglossoides CBS 100239]|uniref:FluG domain-containing protein n=1 Tax=Tolypocladium ophioglossoides (strain CBS 100239) TaxID=1163406 RepID=A0A0L0N0E7_TOLOC|nr:hypothetical protein TOPH_08097 [Tolypocladium ophioglossoides CBS 100239]